MRYVKKLPFKKQWKGRALLIYDNKLARSSDFRKWVARFGLSYPVVGGENLKSIERFPAHIKSILEMTEPVASRELVVVCVGGGSVGDFGGFVASVLRRGVALEHIPSTWLAALDSAHGGKTALNVSGLKNQIGSFWPAQEVYLCAEFLTAQPAHLAQDALGELYKIALVDGGDWTRKLALDHALSPGEKLQKYLLPAVQAKYRVVKADPRELLGKRQVLNLGHTLAHAIEGKNLGHGGAVSQGIYFALEWSKNRNHITSRDYDRIQTFLNQGLGKPKIPRYSAARLLSKIKKDKRTLGQELLNFVFIRSLGQITLGRVSHQELIKEAKRQGWC